MPSANRRQMLRVSARGAVVRLLDLDPGVAECGGRPEQRDIVALVDDVIAAGARDDLLVGVAQHRDGREVAVELTQRPVARRAHLGCDEVLAAELQVVRAAAQTRVDDRRGEQSRDVEHAAGAGDALDRSADRGVVQVQDDAHVLAQIAHEQRGLERVQVRALRADHGGRAGQAGRRERVAQDRVAGEVRDAPRFDDGDEPRVGLVVDHRDGDAGEVQLLDRAQGDVVQPADDDVADPRADVARGCISRGGWARVVQDGSGDRMGSQIGAVTRQRRERQARA